MLRVSQDPFGLGHVLSNHLRSKQACFWGINSNIEFSTEVHVSHSLCTEYEEILERPDDSPCILAGYRLLWKNVSVSPILPKHAMLSLLGPGIPKSPPAGFLALEFRCWAQLRGDFQTMPQCCSIKNHTVEKKWIGGLPKEVKNSGSCNSVQALWHQQPQNPESFNSRPRLWLMSSKRLCFLKVTGWWMLLGARHHG